MNYGVKLADGTFFSGTVGQADDRLQIITTPEEGAEHLLDLMNPEKTKWIGYYVNQLVAEYENYVFSYMQQSIVTGKVSIWMVRKGE